jgi:hypothetical protein
MPTNAAIDFNDRTNADDLKPVDNDRFKEVIRHNFSHLAVIDQLNQEDQSQFNVDSKSFALKKNEITYLAKISTIRRHKRARTDSYFTPLQEWEGSVVEILEDTFTAKLIDVSTNASEEPDYAEFLLSDVSDEDQALLKPGAIFRWSVGYKNTNGTKTRISQIVFRRLPIWTARQLEEAEAVATDLYEGINWE